MNSPQESEVIHALLNHDGKPEKERCQVGEVPCSSTSRKYTPQPEKRCTTLQQSRTEKGKAQGINTDSPEQDFCEV
jgi:hypothetical protein